MSVRSRPSPPLAALPAIAAALDWDAQQRNDDRLAFDRQVAPALPAARNDLVESGVVWLEAVRARAPEVVTVQRRAEATLAWANTAMILLGLLLGGLATLGVFYYDGTGRINVVVVLALFVVLPALLLVPFLLAALPRRILAALPGALPFSALASALSPGRLAPWMLRWLPHDTRETWTWWQGRMGAHRMLYGSVQKWALLRWSQMLGLSYQTAALATAIALVLFTDLAFGWSTTLTTGDPARDAARVHRLTSLLAAPWRPFIADAEPSRELVESSRYYRAAAPTLTTTEAARLGGWWRFVLLAMLVYGWLPRVFTLMLAQLRLRAATRAAWSATPGLTALLRRVRASAIQTASPEKEARVEAYTLHPFPASARGADSRSPAATLSTQVVNWSGVPLPDEVLRQRLAAETVQAAGGSATVQHDQALLRQLADDAPEDGQVAIVVKAWEPPLLEFVDFARALRHALGRGRMILVMPVGVDPAGAPAAPSDSQRGVWQRKLTQLGDPWLRVVDLPPGAAP